MTTPLLHLKNFAPKKIGLMLCFTLYMANYAFTQNPTTKMWDFTFGGTGEDAFFCFQQTSDKGYILGGYSGSGISGVKTQPSFGGPDYWIVKIDSLGIKQWDKDFGGDNDDYLYAIEQTQDGGYILGGASVSGISGSKSEDIWGNSDYWIIKTDSLGNKLWDKDFGGTDNDYLYNIKQTTDGGYILGGISASNIGGNKTQTTKGGYDYWIIKIDSLGNIQWDKDFGGTNTDYLYLNSLIQTNDGGYIFGGWSLSGNGGDKTQPSWGLNDYWIVKTDSLGIKQWDKDFGGANDDLLHSILQTNDNGYILGGRSFSGISGDKTQLTWNNSLDHWIVKIDSSGNKQWDKDYGGGAAEELNDIKQTDDGGYLMSGDSYSGISGDKTEANIGSEQTWVLKTDSLGNIEWDKTLFTSGHDENGLAIQASDNCFIMANFSPQGSAGYKTQSGWGFDDYWIIKFCAILEANFTAPAFLCPGSCIDFTNLSILGTSYQWLFPGAIPDTSSAMNPSGICYSNPGSYDVTLIATNSNGSDTLNIPNYITVFPQPAPQSITQQGDTLSALAGATSYQWYYNGNLIPGATDYFYVAAASGDYNIVATDVNGCEVEAVINDVLASIQYTVDSKQLTIYPNPVQDKFTIQNSEAWTERSRGLTRESAIEISIYNVMGEKIYSEVHTDSSQDLNIDFQTFPAGVYNIVMNQDEKIYRMKFVKQ